MISRTFLSLIAALLLLGCEAEDQVTIGSLIERHTDARGGSEAIEDVHSLRFGLEITEPGFTVRGDYIAMRDGYMRIDIYSGDERVFTEALGPDGGWQLLQGETEPVELSEEGENALVRGLIGNLYGLHELPGLGYKLSLVESVPQDAEDSWVIEQLSPDGFSKRRFIDKSSFLVVREIESSALHPDLDSTKTQQETHYSEYEAVEGVMFSRRTEKIDADTGEIVQTVVVTKITINPEVDTSKFSRPSESTIQE